MNKFKYQIPINLLLILGLLFLCSCDFLKDEDVGEQDQPPSPSLPVPLPLPMPTTTPAPTPDPGHNHVEEYHTESSIPLSPILIPPPSNLSYQKDNNSLIFTKGIFSNYIPTYKGGKIETFEIFPSPPKNMSFNPNSGEVSGAPFESFNNQFFKITGRNKDGEENAEIYLISESVEAKTLATGKTYACISSVEKYSKKPKAPICWGDLSKFSTFPDRAKEKFWPSFISDQLTRSEIITTAKNYLCLSSTNEVWCLGKNDRGQLGNNSFIESQNPVKVQEINGKIFSLSSGYSHVCAIVDEQLLCWGDNSMGQLGNNFDYRKCTDIFHSIYGDNFTTRSNPYSDSYSILSSKCKVPIKVTGVPDGLLKITSGNFHNCALNEKFQVFCWGSNEKKQLGNETMTDINPRPVQASIPKEGEIADIASRFDTNCVLFKDGDIYCWGESFVNNPTSNILPTKMNVLIRPLSSLPKEKIKGIRIGFGNVCAFTEDEVVCWGNETESATDKLTPTFSGKIQDVSLGEEFSCAIIKQQDKQGIQCWGKNNKGQLGIGKTSFEYSHIFSPVWSLPWQ